MNETFIGLALGYLVADCWSLSDKINRLDKILADHLALDPNYEKVTDA